MTASHDAERTARLEAGRQLFARPWHFTTAASAASHVPPADRTEIALAGRSNVGKSSLLNALAGQKSLARTSNTPGRTQQLNFFESDAPIRIVDMPGYGYARAPRSTVAAWTQLVFDYLRGRPGLRRVYLLIDARHGPKDVDRNAMDLLDKAGVSYQIVLTKADKPGRDELARIIRTMAAEVARRPAAHPQVLATSSRTGDGLDDLRAAIAGLGAG